MQVANQAAYDLQAWAPALGQVLANYIAQINCSATTPIACTINIVWSESSVAINAQEAAAQAANPQRQFRKSQLYPVRAAMKKSTRERGFTMIELMVAVTISVFLLFGVLKVVQTTSGTYTAQNQLAQLQDNERLVTAFIGEIIESAGYFPNPKVYTAAAVMPAVGVFAGSGQAVFGTLGGGFPGDTIRIRYGAALNDNVYGCQGTQNTTIAPYDTFTNYFYVKNGAPVLWIRQHRRKPADAVLVTGVSNLQFLYGVKRNAADTGSRTDTYSDRRPDAGRRLAGGVFGEDRRDLRQSAECRQADHDHAG